MLINKAYIAIVLMVFAAACTKATDLPAVVDTNEGPNPDIGPSVVEDRLALEAGLERIVYHVGPIDLPAGLSVKDMSEKPLTMSFQTSKAVWVVAFTPKIVDINGTELPSDLLHMAVVSNMHEENAFCADAGGGNPFAVSGALLESVSLPEGYGYPVLSSDPIQARVVLKNDSDKTYNDVFFELTLAVKPMGEFASLKDVRPFYVEPSPCDHAETDIAPKQFSEIESSFTVPFDSSVVAVQGVLGDFGSNLSLFSGEDLDPIWSANAELGEENEIVSLDSTPIKDAGSIVVKEGSVIKMSASYDNRSNSWIHKAPAAVMVYAAPK